MAYQRTTDTTKADANTLLLADSLDAAVNGAISTYKNQVTDSENESEGNFQQLVAAGNMSLADQLSYRQNQIKGTTDAATRTTLRTAISTLKAQINQKSFSDGYTKQLQDNASGIESTESVISWLHGQLGSATDTTVIDKINTELTTWNKNLFNSQQKILTDQTTYAKASGNMTTINDQITALVSAKSTALLNGDTETAANLDLQIQNLQSFVAVQAVTTKMQNFASATVAGSSTAMGLLNSYNAEISTANSSTPITINGTTYASEAAYWTATRDAYIADTGGSGLFSRITKENTDAIAVANSKNTLTTDALTAINAQFTSLASNPLLAPFAAQIATAKQTAIQAGGDALAKTVENSFDENYDLNKAVSSLKAISDQGVNVDDTMNKIITAASQVQSSTVANIMTSANALMAANPGLSVTQAVNQAIAAGAGTILSPNDLTGKSPAQTVIDEGNAAKNGTSPSSNSLTLGTPASPATPGTSITAQQVASLPNLTPGQTSDNVKTLQSFLIGQGYNIVDGPTGYYGPETQAAIAAWQKANNIQTNGNAGYFGPASKAFLSSETSAGPESTTASPSTTPTNSSAPKLPTATVTPTVTSTPSTQASPTPAPIPTATPTKISTTPTVAGTASNPSGTIDYTLHSGESIDAYTARIASARASQTFTPPPPSTTNWNVTPGVTGPTTSTSTTSTSPAPKPTSTASSVLKSSNEYSLPTGLTAGKTAGGGTAALDAQGNLYVQSSPGVYTLNNSLK